MAVSTNIRKEMYEKKYRPRQFEISTEIRPPCLKLDAQCDPPNSEWVATFLSQFQSQNYSVDNLLPEGSSPQHPCQSTHLSFRFFSCFFYIFFLNVVSPHPYSFFFFVNLPSKLSIPTDTRMFQSLSCFQLNIHTPLDFSTWMSYNHPKFNRAKAKWHILPCSAHSLHALPM